MERAIIVKDGDAVEITAPDGKEMVFDSSLLQHGVLSLGEYGPSGVKIAAFRNWDCAYFLKGDEGYKLRPVTEAYGDNKEQD